MSDETTNGDDTSIPPSPEDQALLEDLKAYDNPEVFEDANLPQFYRLFIRTLYLPEVPYMLDIVVNGEDLPNALGKTMIVLMQRDPDFERSMEELYGTKGWEETNAAIAADKEFIEAEQDMRRFFVRHFPKLMVHLYNISALISVMAVFGVLPESTEDKVDWEKSLKRILKITLGNMEKDIKRWLGTRKRGGSAAKLTEDIRTSLYEYYDDIHLMTKPIKKDYNETFKRFEESRRQTGYKFEEWQQFWITHSVGLYPDYDKDFLASFAQREHPSASEITYRWLSYRTGGKRSYVERLVKQTRRAAGKTRARKKGTMKKPE